MGRRIFYRPPEEITCGRCGRTLPLAEFSRDSSKPSGRKSICIPCDRKKAKSYYQKNRAAVLARATAKRVSVLPPLRFCEECGGLLEGRRRVCCGSSRCLEARARRLDPAGYAERQRRKVEARTARRRDGGR